MNCTAKPRAVPMSGRKVPRSAPSATGTANGHTARRATACLVTQRAEARIRELGVRS